MQFLLISQRPFERALAFSWSGNILPVKTSKVHKAPHWPHTNHTTPLQNVHTKIGTINKSLESPSDDLLCNAPVSFILKSRDLFRSKTICFLGSGIQGTKLNSLHLAFRYQKSEWPLLRYPWAGLPLRKVAPQTLGSRPRVL